MMLRLIGLVAPMEPLDRLLGAQRDQHAQNDDAASLRRFSLVRRGWKNIGVVSGYDLEDAERRFYDAWVRGAPIGRTEPPPVPSESPPLTQSHDIIGLFPEPGGGSR